MQDYSRLTRMPIQNYVSPEEVEEVFEELGIDEEDQEIVFRFLERYRPDHDLDYLVEVVDQHVDHHNIEKIAGAAFAIAFRAAVNSSRTRGKELSR